MSSESAAQKGHQWMSMLPPLAALPEHLLLAVAQHLDPPSVLALSLTARAFAPLIRNRLLWHGFLGYAPEDSLQPLEQYQKDYVVIRTFRGETAAPPDFHPKPAPHCSAVTRALHLCIRVLTSAAWDYVTFLCDIAFFLLFLLSVDRTIACNIPLTYLLFLISCGIRTLPPYAVLLLLRIAYGPLFDPDAFVARGMSISFVVTLYTLSSSYVGILFFCPLVVFLTLLLFFLSITNVLPFFCCLLPLILLSVGAFFSCPNFTFFPTWATAPCSITKILYLSFPSLCFLVGFSLSSYANTGTADLQYSSAFVPFFLSIAYVLGFAAGNALYLECCHFQLLVKDIPLSSVLFPCCAQKTLPEARFIARVCLVVALCLCIPSVILLILLSLRLDGLIDVSFVYIGMPVYVVLIGFFVFSVITHVGCWVYPLLKKLDNYGEQS